MFDSQGIVSIFPENGFHANAYLIRTTDGLSIIDPSFPPEELSGGDRDRLKTLFATHGHFDHTAGAADWLKNRSHIPYFMHKDDFLMSDDPQYNVSALFGRACRTAKPSHELVEDEPIPVGGGYYLRPYHTPGHTQGSVVLLMERMLSNGLRKPFCLFTGDCIFLNSIGRCDFLGGSSDAMNKSLRKILLIAEYNKFPSDLPLYFGHGRAATWGETLQLNPWLRQFR